MDSIRRDPEKYVKKYFGNIVKTFRKNSRKRTIKNYLRKCLGDFCANSNEGTINNSPREFWCRKEYEKKNAIEE